MGNTLLDTSEPLSVLRARDGQPDWDCVGALLDEWRPDLVLVGDPLNMDGSVSDLAAQARRFARRLEGRFACATEMVDERLTSFAAKTDARAGGHDGNYRRRPVDSLAAELILRSWLTGRSASGP